MSVQSLTLRDTTTELPEEDPNVVERMRRIPPGENHEFVRGTKWEVEGKGISLVYRGLHPLKPSYTIVAYGSGERTVTTTIGTGQCLRPGRELGSRPSQIASSSTARRRRSVHRYAKPSPRLHPRGSPKRLPQFSKSWPRKVCNES